MVNDFLVNTTTAGFQGNPTISGLTNGGFVVAWEDNSRSGGDTSDLYHLSFVTGDRYV
jgi:serralysin